jgi:hypothetical protein
MPDAVQSTLESLLDQAANPAADRAALEARLRDEGRDDLALVLEKCAQPLALVCVCCGKTIMTEKGCKKRWCPVCAPSVSAARLERAARVAGRFQWPLAVTLTTTNLSQASNCIATIKDVFKDFRRTAWWKALVKGGIYSVEITHKGKGFHPHIHALLDCRWLAVEVPEPTRWSTPRQREQLCKRAQNELAEVWGGYVQRSKAIVWVERAYGKALQETLKYAVKPADLLQCSCDAGDIIDLIDSGRTMARFGCAHSMSKEFVGCDEQEERLVPCQKCNAVNSVMPDDIVSMSEARPDLASGRFHQLASARAAIDDPTRTFDPAVTLPRKIPKGKIAGRLRVELSKPKAC